MGCDRNLFTLRLVLNQTRGEWRWQAAGAGRCIGGGGSGGLPCHTGPALQPPLQGGGSWPRPLGWRDGGRKGRMKRTNDEWCANDKSACPTPQMEWLSSSPESRYESPVLHSAKCTVTQPDVCEADRKQAVTTDMDSTCYKTAGPKWKLLKTESAVQISARWKNVAGKKLLVIFVVSLH